MPRTPTEDRERDLRDPEYAKLYGAAHAKAEFAVTLARARAMARMTQEELACKLGRSQPYIAKLEGGDANPTLGAVGSILAALGLRLAMHTELLLPSLGYAEGPPLGRATTSSDEGRIQVRLDEGVASSRVGALVS